MTTTATIPDSDIVFRRDRDGSRALVFVHGFLDDQHVWAPVLAGLSAPGFETVQFDQAGFGRHGADLDVGTDAPRHREHAERRQINGLDAVVDEHAEAHRQLPRCAVTASG